MKLEMTLRPEKAEQIRSAILDYIDDCRKEDEETDEGAYLFLDHPDEVRARIGWYDGEAGYYPESARVEYTTASGLGYYDLTGDNTLYFEGRRNSFLDGTALFVIEEKDCISWEILESQTPERSPWR